MQLAWNLRPFIGSRGLPFEVVRQREGNFYLAVIQSAADLVEAGTTPVTPPEPNSPTTDDGE